MTTTTPSSPLYAVRQWRHFYGPRSVLSVPVIGTLDACRAWVEDEGTQIYHLSHNEAGRPTYRVVPARTCRADLIADAIRI